MLSADKAQALLDELSLPKDTTVILAHPKFWNAAFCRLYLERCDALRFEDPEVGRQVAEIAPQLASRVPRHQVGGESGWCSLQIDALGVAGSAFRTVGEVDLAEQTFHVATVLFTDDADDMACARLMRRTAYLRAAQDRFAEAIELTEESIEVYRLHGESIFLGCALVDQAVVFIRAKKFELAARDLLESLDILEDDQNSSYYYSAVHNLAYALLKTEGVDPLEAIAWLSRARELNTEPVTSVSRAKLLWLEGEAWAKMGRYPEAEAAFGEACRQLWERGAPLDAGLAAVELAEIYLMQGRTDDVRRLAGELFPLFRVIQNDLEAVEALKLFHRAALADGLTSEILVRIKAVLRDRRSDTFHF